ncbi:hypothetical protein SFK227_0457 [Shigella flexneri K-227]|uniref:Uncharacterized protein n=1 Tax=Shigella flexneri K-227 TaxID=766147 RepID=F5NQS1_SHIFL|nr:hypothetical protein SFK227_0457 [Shigella flexneri K-227]
MAIKDKKRRSKNSTVDFNSFFGHWLIRRRVSGLLIKA